MHTDSYSIAYLDPGNRMCCLCEHVVVALACGLYSLSPPPWLLSIYTLTAVIIYRRLENRTPRSPRPNHRVAPASLPFTFCAPRASLPADLPDDSCSPFLSFSYSAFGYPVRRSLQLSPYMGSVDGHIAGAADAGPFRKIRDRDGYVLNPKPTTRTRAHAQ